MLTPKLANLTHQFEDTCSLQQQTSAALDAAYAEFGDDVETPLAHEWERLHEATADLAWEILKEPTRNATDFAAKLSVWDRCIWDKNDDSDDITNKSGWMDHASNRLLTDAWLILGLARQPAA